VDEGVDVLWPDSVVASVDGLVEVATMKKKTLKVIFESKVSNKPLNLPSQ